MRNFIAIRECWFELLKEAGINYPELILLAKIDTLSRGIPCIASNAYFSELLKTSERNIRNYLKRLKDAGLIQVEEKRIGRCGVTRCIRVQHEQIMKLLTMAHGDTETGATEETGHVAGKNLNSERKEFDVSEEEICFENVKNSKENIWNSEHKKEEKRLKKNSKVTGALESAPVTEPNQAVSAEQIELVIELFKQKQKYSVIQKETNLSFGEIKVIIDSYKDNKNLKSTGYASKAELTQIPKADGSFSGFYKEEIKVAEEDCPLLFHLFTESGGEYGFDKAFVATWFKQDYGWEEGIQNDME